MTKLGQKNQDSNPSEILALIKDFLLLNEPSDVQEVLTDALAEYVVNTDHDDDHVKYMVHRTGDIAVFILQLEKQYRLFTQKNKEVCHA